MKSNQFKLSLLEKRFPQEIHLNNGCGLVSQATVSSDHCYLATSNYNQEKEVNIWDLKTRQIIKNHKASSHSIRLEVFEFSQNCEEFYVMDAGLDLLTIINLKQDIKREIYLLGRCERFKLSKDQNFGCQYIDEVYFLKVWDLKKEQIINTFEFESETFIADCQFLNNSLILTLSVCEDRYKLLSLWDIKNNRRVRQRRDVCINGYAKMYVDGDAAIIHYSADEMSFIEVWNLVTFSIIRKIYNSLFGMINLRFCGAQVIGYFAENLMMEDNFNFGNKYNNIVEVQGDNDLEDEDFNENEFDGQEIEPNENESKLSSHYIEEKSSRNQNSSNEFSQDYLKFQSFNILTFKKKIVNSTFLKSSDFVWFFDSGYIYQQENSNILICVLF